MDTHRPPPLFTESQRFRQPLIWIPLLAGTAFALVQAAQGVRSGDPSTLDGLLVGGVAFGLVLTFVWWLRLDTRVDEEGLLVRFAPLHRRGRWIPWAEVERAWIRTYRPIREFGGWGIRFGRGGRAYTVRGTTGLQLILRDGSRILVGTNRPSPLRVVLSGLTGRGIVAPGDPEGS